MAYLDLNYPSVVAGGELYEAAPTADQPLPASGFSALEWSVVALARRESLSSLREPGRIAIALGTLFGLHRNPRLADERLEALRRIAVLAWHNGYAVPTSELRAFKAAGFSVEQYDALQVSIGRGRAQRRSRSA